jgi:anti-anti-sigma factor
MSNPPAPFTSPPAPRVGPPPLFSCTRWAESRGSIRLVLAGELDLSAHAHFEQSLKDALSDADRVILDLHALTLIDCASLSVIYNGAIEARRRNAILIMLDLRGQVRQVLDLVGAPDGVAVLERSDAEPLAAVAY